MDDDDAVGRAEFFALCPDLLGHRAVSGDFRGREDGVKALRIEVMKNDLMAPFAQIFANRLCDRMVEACGVGMTEDDQELYIRIRFVPYGRP